MLPKKMLFKGLKKWGEVQCYQFTSESDLEQNLINN